MANMIHSCLWHFALVSIFLVTMCSLSGMRHHPVINPSLIFASGFGRERFFLISEPDTAFFDLQTAMIPWTQMEILQLLSTLTNGKMMAIWLVYRNSAQNCMQFSSVISEVDYYAQRKFPLDK